jgi:hypothetical protein
MLWSLAFLLALLVASRRMRTLIGVVTAFTVAHSLTLAAAALGWVHVPQPPVEACIALSIVFVASEIIRSREGRPGLTERAPWVVAFTFGLLHGLGFAGALAEVGLPADAIPQALLLFNIGIEIGQPSFVALVLAVGHVLIQLAPRLTTSLRWLPPYAIGSFASFWVIERIHVFF